jgi:hypothetical protein
LATASTRRGTPLFEVGGSRTLPGRRFSAVREGRIHRYKGHAVRKNVAATHAAGAFHHPDSDVWETVFALGRASRPTQANDLVPYWVFPGDAKIERHVPAMPFSREVERLHDLRRSLAIYRMVFGQSRQEDLITYLLAKLPEDERTKIVAELQIDLSPASRNQNRFEDSWEKIDFQPVEAGASG